MRYFVPFLAGLLPLVEAQVAPVGLKGSCSQEVIQNLSLGCSTEEPCPLYLELAGAELAGPRIVLTGNIHTSSATIESILLISDDNGLTWTEAHSRIPSAVLDQIQFADVEAGWISGHLLTNVPRDAFFLLTTDGGKTWRRRAVTSESRTGAIEAFWFDSRTRGRMILDRVRAAENGFRHELWESMTGGESWSIRQVDSKPVPFSKPSVEPVLRLRTDAQSKTWQLQRRDGANWAPLAAFAVAAGECKPEPPTETEAEAPPQTQSEPEPPEQAPPGRSKPPSLKKPGV